MGDLFSWGKGGSSSAPPPMPAMPRQEMPDMTGLFGMMGGMMEGMMANMQMMQEQAAQQQETLLANMSMNMSMPEPFRTPDVDWAEAESQLKNKMSAQYNVDEARRKGRTDTILSSPLLDEEDAITTGSVLAGK